MISLTGHQNMTVITIVVASILSVLSTYPAYAAVSQKQTPYSRRLSSSITSSHNTLEYFETRWHKKELQQNRPSLQFMKIPIQSIHYESLSRPVQSLSVRGGGFQTTVPTSFVTNMPRPRRTKSSSQSAAETIKLMGDNRFTSNAIPMPIVYQVQKHVNGYRGNTVEMFSSQSHYSGELKPSRQSRAIDVHRLIGLRSGQLTTFFSVFSEAVLFAGTHLETAWSDNVRPKMIRWWKNGRSQRGLFRIETWKDVSSIDDYRKRSKVIQQAWDRQFQSKKVQLLIGCAAGLFVARTVAIVGATTIIMASATLVAAELKHHMITRPRRTTVRSLNRYRFSPAVSRLGSSIDSGLERFRLDVHNTIENPSRLTSNLKGILQNIWIPLSVQRGIAIGIIMGILSRSV